MTRPSKVSTDSEIDRILNNSSFSFDIEYDKDNDYA